MIGGIKRPVLRYHGGKWMLARWIIQHFPQHRIYVEPFGGAASVLLQKPRSYSEVYNDLDKEIVNVFRVLRDAGAAERLENLIRLTPFARDEFLESYIPAEDAIEQARRTIARAFMGFGSVAATGFKTGFRANSDRSGTTGARDWRNLPGVVAGWVERLQGVVIENRPATEVMLQHDSKQTLHYVDPPYVPSTRKVGNPYCGKAYRFELTDEEHRQLAGFLGKLEGMVVLSGYPSELYCELYRGWDQVQRKSNADGARPRTEILWLNESAARHLQAGLFEG